MAVSVLQERGCIVAAETFTEKVYSPSSVVLNPLGNDRKAKKKTLDSTPVHCIYWSFEYDFIIQKLRKGKVEGLKLSQVGW